MISLRLILVIAALLSATAAHAQSTCPWLTSGTAAAVLNGPATLTATVLPSGEGACTFTLQQNAAASTLKITVTSEHHPACPANSRSLTGIGNEAVTCSPNQTTDIVSSRVRNLYFTVRLTLSGKPPVTSAQQQSAVEQIAEEVAGSLF